MKWDLATILGTALVVSNAVGILVLCESILLGFPYITLFSVIFFMMYELNRRLF